MSDDISAYDIAEKLYRNATADAEFRAVASRAYMAAFQHAIRHNKTNFSPQKSSLDHRDLIKHLQSQTDQSLRRAGAALLRLRFLRNWADYDLHTPFTKKLAEEALDRAYEIIFELLP
ncbi:MAG: hypothetical protein OEL53_06190 [Rhodospirillales bacterium]|nr:hypothetical protein [Rhodospirillales bacterium]